MFQIDVYLFVLILIVVAITNKMDNVLQKKGAAIKQHHF